MRIEQGGNSPHLPLSTTYTKQTSHHIQQLQQHHQQQYRQHKHQLQHTNGEERTNNNNHSGGEEEDMFLYKNKQQTQRTTSEELEYPMSRSELQSNYHHQCNQRCPGEFRKAFFCVFFNSFQFSKHSMQRTSQLKH